MASSFEFALVTPERTLFEGEVTMVTLRSANGDIAFLANHSPFIGTVTICPLKIMLPDGSVCMAAVDGGFVRAANNKVSVVTPSGSLATELEVEAILHMKREAEGRLSQGENSGAELALRAAEVRLEIANA